MLEDNGMYRTMNLWVSLIKFQELRDDRNKMPNYAESPCMCADLLKYVSTFEFLSNYFFLSQSSEHF